MGPDRWMFGTRPPDHKPYAIRSYGNPRRLSRCGDRDRSRARGDRLCAVRPGHGAADARRAARGEPRRRAQARGGGRHQGHARRPALSEPHRVAAARLRRAAHRRAAGAVFDAVEARRDRLWAHPRRRRAAAHRAGLSQARLRRATAATSSPRCDARRRPAVRAGSAGAAPRDRARRRRGGHASLERAAGRRRRRLPRRARAHGVARPISPPSSSPPAPPRRPRPSCTTTPRSPPRRAASASAWA